MTAPLVTRWPVHGDDEIAAVAEVLRSGKTNYWTGPHGMAFEEETRRAWGVHHTLAVSNGTTALEACLRGVGLDEFARSLGGRPEAEVIVPARTFIATASAVVHAGGKPVLADIDADTLCLSAKTVEAAATPNTVGVIVVHYGGLPCPDMPEIVRLCMRRGWWIIEDAAHAHGAPRVGLMSHATAWSMCVGKIMSSGGEGGLVGCLDPKVADKMRAYRDHGRFQMTGKRMDGGAVGLHYEYLCEEFGSNLRMTEMQAVLARYALRRLTGEIARRREIAATYDAVLGDASMFTPEQRAEHVRYMYHVRVESEVRDWMMEKLVEAGIPARVGGAPSLAAEPAFRKRGWNYATPVADRVGNEVFSLPLYPSMTDGDVNRVAEALRKVL